MAGGERLVASTLIGALAVQTVEALSPLGGDVTLPSPRRYLGVYTLWFVLGLAASAGAEAARAAGQLSVLVLGTITLLGPGGRKISALMERVAKITAPQEAQ